MRHRFIRYLQATNSIVMIILCREAYLFYECPSEGYVKVAKDDAEGTLYQYTSSDYVSTVPLYSIRYFGVIAKDAQ